MSAASRRTRLLHRMIDEAADRRPEAPAVRCNGETLTYGELARQSHGLARVLLGTGLARRDRVAVLLDKGPRVAVGFYGALASGGTLVPIDPRSPLEQVVRILRATGATRLVSEPGKGNLVREAAAACPELTHVVGLEPDEDRPFEALPWDTAPLLSVERGKAEGTDEVSLTGAFAGIAETGTLMLRINDSPGELGDNAGTLSVRVEPLKPATAP